MQINTTNVYKPSFGHISKKAVNTVRNQAEGYITDTFYDGSKHKKESKEGYAVDSCYDFFDYSQLRELDTLVKKASKLKKTVIGVSSDINAENNHIGIFYTTANGDNCFAPLIFPYDTKGNGDDTLDVLEATVRAAEYMEKNDSIATIDKSYLEKILITQECNNNRRFDRFKTKEENELLKSVYEKTIG